MRFLAEGQQNSREMMGTVVRMCSTLDNQPKNRCIAFFSVPLQLSKRAVRMCSSQISFKN